MKAMTLMMTGILMGMAITGKAYAGGETQVEIPEISEEQALMIASMIVGEQPLTSGERLKSINFDDAGASE